MLYQALNILEQRGGGQPLVIIFEAEAKSELPFYLVDYLMDHPIKDCRMILLSVPRVSDIGCNKLTQCLINFLDHELIKQASFLALGDAGAVVQNLAIANIKRVRRLILVNCPTRPHLNFFEKLMNKVEKILPLGLPFRSVGSAFDSRSFLQRVRAPALIVLSAHASTYHQAQTKILSESMATAWSVKLSIDREREEFGEILEKFYGVPAKRPQKNRAA